MKCSAPIQIAAKLAAFFPMLALGLAPSIARADETPVSVKIQSVFAPSGFDDNDSIEVVVTGTLPDTCYKIDDVKFTVTPAHEIRLTQWARQFTAPNCLKIFVPFSSVVHLGTLAAGDYKLMDQTGATTEALHVVRAIHPWEVDENLYAPVDQASVEKTETETAQIVLQGRLTNSCLSLDPAHVTVIHSGKVLEILPIMQMRAGTDCAPTLTPFTVQVDLPALADGPYLAHVRSLSGKAINTMFYMLNE